MKMKQRFAYTLPVIMAATIWSCGGGGKNNNDNQGQTALPPYTVELVEQYNENLPNLHSFTHATYNDQIILFGGRRLGLHSSNYTFGNIADNQYIYVVDTKNWNEDASQWVVYKQPYASIIKADAGKAPSNFTDIRQFGANNAEFFTANDTVLYVIGGLVGATKTYTSPFTMPYMTAINLGALVSAVKNNVTMPQGSIRQAYNYALAVTGGEVAGTNNSFQLIFGWNVDLAANNANLTGYYSHKVNSFNYTDSNGSLSLIPNPLCSTCWDNQDTTSNLGQLRRRDGSVSPAINPANGNPLTMYYSGVFKYGSTNFTSPVYITGDSVSVVDSTAFNMRGNVYTCQVIPMYSKLFKAFYATMLGGMTNVNFSGSIAKSKTPVLLDNTNAPFITPDPTGNFQSVPFSNRLTTIKLDEKNNFTQYLLPDSFPPTKKSINFPTFPLPDSSVYSLPAGSNPFNGAEAEILWNVKETMPNGVIDLDAFLLAHPTGGSIGYLYGGILSRVPNLLFVNSHPSQYSIASNRIFSIRVKPYILETQTEEKK